MHNLDIVTDTILQFSSSPCLKVGFLVNVHPFIALLQRASSASLRLGETRLHC